MEEIISSIKMQPEKNAEENKSPKPRDLSTVECFKCHGFGHYARNCEPGKDTLEKTVVNTVPENWD